jgi:hypothetical protein
VDDDAGPSGLRFLRHLASSFQSYEEGIAYLTNELRFDEYEREQERAGTPQARREVRKVSKDLLNLATRMEAWGPQHDDVTDRMRQAASSFDQLARNMARTRARPGDRVVAVLFLLLREVHGREYDRFPEIGDTTEEFMDLHKRAGHNLEDVSTSYKALRVALKEIERGRK